MIRRSFFILTALLAGSYTLAQETCDPCVEENPCEEEMYAVEEEEPPCEEEVCEPCAVEEPCCVPCEEEPCEDEMYAVEEEEPPCEEEICEPCAVEEPCCVPCEEEPCEEEMYAVEEEEPPCEEEICEPCAVEEPCCVPCEEEPYEEEMYAVEEEEEPCEEVVEEPAPVKKKEPPCRKPREPRAICTPIDPCPMKAGLNDEVYLAFDFLWWRAENHGYSYGFNRISDSISQGKVMRINPNWDPGFRLGLGWNTGYDQWDILAAWTWYHNHATTTQDTVASGNLGYYPQWPVARDSVLGPYKRATAGYTLHYDTGDLEFGRGYYATKSLALRPYIGARAAWIYQAFRNHFSLPVSPTNTVDQDRKFSGRNTTWGAGPRIGADGEFHLDYGVSFLGKAAAALVYGKTHVRHTTQTFITGNTGYGPEGDYSEHFWQLSPNLQLQLGVQWEHYFPREDKFLKIGVSGEANYWWNQFQLPVMFENYLAPMPTVGNQPVTMEGLTFEIEIDF